MHKLCEICVCVCVWHRCCQGCQRSPWYRSGSDNVTGEGAAGDTYYTWMLPFTQLKAHAAQLTHSLIHSLTHSFTPNSILWEMECARPIWVAHTLTSLVPPLPPAPPPPPPFKGVRSLSDDWRTNRTNRCQPIRFPHSHSHFHPLRYDPIPIRSESDRCFCVVGDRVVQ